MSGMLGAMAIASVSARRQADGGAGPASAGSPAWVGVSFPAAGFWGSIVGASAGRGFGSGTDAGSAARCSARLLPGGGSPQGCEGDRTVAADAIGVQSTSNAAAAI